MEKQEKLQQESTVEQCIQRNNIEQKQINRDLVQKNIQKESTAHIQSSINTEKKSDNKQSSKEIEQNPKQHISKEKTAQFSKDILQQYFGVKQLICQKISQKIATGYSHMIQQTVQQNITKGALFFSQEKVNIKNLLYQVKLTEQQLKAIKNKSFLNKRNQLIKQLDAFKQNNSQRSTNLVTESQLQNTKYTHQIQHLILSKQQHKKLVKKFITSQKKHQNHYKWLLESRLQRQKSLQQQKSNQTQKKKQIEIESKRKLLEQKIRKQKVQHQSFIKQQRQSLQKYKSMKKKRFLYQNMEDKYKSQVLIPQLEQRKIKLKEIREFNRKFNISELKKHEAEYIDRKSEGSKTQSRHKISSFHYIPPEKSKRLAQLLEQQRMQTKIKHQRKRIMTQENKMKQINFISDLRIKYRPKIDTKKQQQIQLRLKSEQSETRKKSNCIDLKKLGMRYFQEAKKFTKPRSLKQKTQGNDFTQKSQAQLQSSNILLSLTKRKQKSQPTSNKLTYPVHNNIDINQSKRKQIRKLINSQNLRRQQKLQRLKIENDKIDEIYKRKEKYFQENQDDEKTRQQAINLLLNSIQAKMGILDVSQR